MRFIIPVWQESLQILNDLTGQRGNRQNYRAVKKGLAKLGHYYGLTKLNHFNIIATGKHLQISLLKTIMERTVYHLALHLFWFRLIDNDSYDHAKAVFEYHPKQPHWNHHNHRLDLISQGNPIHFWQASLIACHHHSLPQPHLHQCLRGMLSLSMELNNVTCLGTLCIGQMWVYVYQGVTEVGLSVHWVYFYNFSVNIN